MIAVVEAWRAGLFGRRHWATNLIAGLIVGVRSGVGSEAHLADADVVIDSVADLAALLA